MSFFSLMVLMESRYNKIESPSMENFGFFFLKKIGFSIFRKASGNLEFS